MREGEEEEEGRVEVAEAAGRNGKWDQQIIQQFCARLVIGSGRGIIGYDFVLNIYIPSYIYTTKPTCM